MKAYAVPFEKYVNLADARLGTKAISVTDDWFADVNRLFQPTPAVWKEGVFDDNGKWMDGWESRRKRFEGYDSAVIRLGVPGSIKGVDIDTSFFTGNFPPSASLEGCFVAAGDPHSAGPAALDARAFPAAGRVAGRRRHGHARRGTV